MELWLEEEAKIIRRQKEKQRQIDEEKKREESWKEIQSKIYKSQQAFYLRFRRRNFPNKLKYEVKQISFQF